MKQTSSGLRLTLRALSACAVWPLAQAQTPAPNGPTTLPPVVVTGNPLASDSLTQPSSVLTGDALTLRRASTLGETLNTLPGVSSTYFGPNANRPVIRGQDGDRIRVLNNAGATLDASALSFDHAVPIEPLIVERLEVLRGPAALLYGGSAVGGVVNAIDNRIPKTPIDGVEGAGELRLGGAADERAAVGLVEVGGQGFALHADAFKRKTDDLRVPDFDRPVEGGGTERRSRIVNSASDAKGGAVGGSMVWDHGHLGASVDTYRNDYGVVAEEDVLIRMKRDKAAIEGAWRDLDGPIRAVRARVQHTDYEHEEVEGTGEVGTTFTNKGSDGRIELEHAPIGALRGVFGLQAETARFEALGEEAFVPSTKTRQWAVFAHEEWRLPGEATVSFGARAERTKIESRGDAAGADEPRFGEADSRSFSTASAAVGTVWPLGGGVALTGNLAYTERAPTNYELYANGVHVATAAFERGDADLAIERSNNLDVGLRWQQGPNRLSASVFASRFGNYIGLLPTGEQVAGEEGEVPVYAFEGVKARFHGFEVDGSWRVLERAGQQLDLEGGLDQVRATNRDTGEPLPRIAPLRLKLGAAWAVAGWTLRGEAVHATRQDRVPDDDAATPSYTVVNLSVSRPFNVGPTRALAFVKLDNVGDELAYNASTIATVRDLAPLAGRSLQAGVRVSF